MLDYRDICLKTCDLARRAGAYIAEQRSSFTLDRVEFKGEQNLVSYVDKQTEQMVVEGLRELTPEAGFITEEGTVAAESGHTLQWIVDPLDGTTNFVHGYSPYCVSIALRDGDETVVGVVYEVTRREMFYAWRESYAYLNGERIQVSTTPSLGASLIEIGFAYSEIKKNDGFLEAIVDFQNHTNGVRRIGSAAADLVYVACGRADGFFQSGLSPWDVAAGAMIARQAGARVSDYKRGDDYLFGRRIVASNPLIYDEFVSKIR